MALAPAFAISANTDPGTIILTDTSTGTDVNVVSRRVSLYKVDNTLLVPVIPWVLSTNPNFLQVLQKDYALNVLVEWLDSTGAAVYSVSQIWAFVNFAKLFAYQLVQKMAAKPTIVNDINFWNNYVAFNGMIKGAQNSIDPGFDIAGSQNNIDQYTEMMNHSISYF